MIILKIFKFILFQTVFPLVTTILEIFLLIGLSSHLSKLLVVYTEIIQLPTNKHMKETVICIITGKYLFVWELRTRDCDYFNFK